MAAFKTIRQHSTTKEISGFEMALNWSNSQGRFCSIDVIPQDNDHQHVTWHGSHNGISLVSKDGTVSMLY